jgi:hypothetical protein
MPTLTFKTRKIAIYRAKKNMQTKSVHSKVEISECSCRIPVRIW